MKRIWEGPGMYKDETRNPHAHVKNDLIREIDTIIGGPYVEGESKKTQKNYAMEAKDSPYDKLFGQQHSP